MPLFAFADAAAIDAAFRHAIFRFFSFAIFFHEPRSHAMQHDATLLPAERYFLLTFAVSLPPCRFRFAISPLLSPLFAMPPLRHAALLLLSFMPCDILHDGCFRRHY
jgi:hypothetical protein